MHKLFAPSDMALIIGSLLFASLMISGLFVEGWWKRRQLAR